MTGTFLRSANSRMRSLTSADCVGAPPGEFTASATARSRSWSNAFVRACSTVLMLMVPRLSGDGVGVITPCSLTTATTGLVVPRFMGSRAASFSVTLMRQHYVSLGDPHAHVPYGDRSSMASLARSRGRVTVLADRHGRVRDLLRGVRVGGAPVVRGVDPAGVDGVRLGRPGCLPGRGPGGGAAVDGGPVLGGDGRGSRG